MNPIRIRLLLASILAIGCAAGTSASRAQDPAKKDEALEKLLEKLDDPKPGSTGTGPVDPAKKPEPAKRDPIKPAEAGKKDEALEKLLEKLDGPKPSEPGKPDEKKAGEVGDKDQSLDKLLEGLGGANDKPGTDEKKQASGGNGGPPAEPPPGGQGGEGSKPNPLDDASKQLDDLLEEKTGRKPKKKPNQQGQGQGQGQGDDPQEGTGPLGDMIKQMREVEDRLGKPDTGSGTRERQKEIVKKIDTLIEEMRNSSSQSQAMKLVRGGQKPGSQPQPGQSNQPGATGQGVGLSKPTPPKTPPAPVELVKEVWGQLPAQFRDDMSNVLNEKALPSKADMIRLYYLSLGKKSIAKEN